MDWEVWLDWVEERDEDDWFFWSVAEFWVLIIFCYLFEGFSWDLELIWLELIGEPEDYCETSIAKSDSSTSYVWLSLVPLWVLSLITVFSSDVYTKNGADLKDASAWLSAFFTTAAILIGFAGALVYVLEATGVLICYFYYTLTAGFGTFAALTAGLAGTERIGLTGAEIAGFGADGVTGFGVDSCLCLLRTCFIKSAVYFYLSRTSFFLVSSSVDSSNYYYSAKSIFYYFCYSL